MDIELDQIKAILDDPGFDLVSALQEHRAALQKRKARLDTLTKTIDSTILDLVGEVKMSEKNALQGL